MTEWRIEPLAATHSRAEFSCGQVSMDAFLRALASQYEKRRLGRTYVALRLGDDRVYGYYTLASGSVHFQNVPKNAARKLPRHPLPVVLLGRLAVDQSVQGQGLGEFLLMDALERCVEISEHIGIHAVEVHAIDDQAKRFYEKYGFVPLLDSQSHLYLPIATIRQATESP
jgi:GNAT superfamily N-acetyltransferase